MRRAVRVIFGLLIGAVAVLVGVVAYELLILGHPWYATGAGCLMLAAGWAANDVLP